LLKLASEQIFNLSDTKISAGFSARLSGNMSLFYGEIQYSLENRKNFLDNLGIDYKGLVCAKQVHGGNIKYVTEQDKGSGALNYGASIEATDAFITDKKNLPLAIFTADCLSVFLYDPKRQAIGLVHAGWRSSRESIVAKTIKLMEQEFHTNACDLHVGFGPAIRSCCYEVDKDFKDFFPKEVLEREGSFFLDLIRVNKRQAEESGVLETNIRDSGFCTFCRNEEFFSFRREGKSCGRMLSVMMLR